MIPMLGKQIRMTRLINPVSRRGFCIAFDHALQLGSCPGLERPEETLDQMAEAGVDAAILPLGSALRFGDRLARGKGPALILRLDQTTMWRDGQAGLSYADGHTRIVASVEDAVSLGAEAVITYLFVGHNDVAEETASFDACAKVNEAARRFGIVHIIETMAARHAMAPDVFSPDLVAFHARVGQEMGADIIKTDWPGSADHLRRITDNLAAPVMIAGGPNQGSDHGTLKLVHEIMRGGAAGILFGRAIFQARNPLAVMKACRAIIHDRATAEEAAELASV